MKRISKPSILAISITLLGLLWAICIAAYINAADHIWEDWGAVTCVAVAVMVADIYLLLGKKASPQAAEIGALGVILTIGYFVIAVLLNTVFVLLRKGDFGWVILTLNLITLVCYFLLTLWVGSHTARVNDQLVKTAVKTAPSKEISRKLGELLAVTGDAQVRERLMKLKEAVDYSTNISTAATKENEERMVIILDEIFQLVIARAEPLSILGKVETAEMIWKMRSSNATSVR